MKPYYIADKFHSDMPTAAFNPPRVIILSPHLLKNNSSLFKMSKNSKKEAREEARARAKAWHDQRQSRS